MSAQSQLTARVRRGAKLLDKKMPGWYRKVKLTTLDMSYCHECVLGQTHGHYFDGMQGLDVSLGNSSRYGFSDAQDKNFPKLDLLWKAEIRARRSAKTA